MVLLLLFTYKKIQLIDLELEVQNYFNVSLKETSQNLDELSQQLSKNEWAANGLSLWLSLAKLFRHTVQPSVSIDWFTADGVFDQAGVIQTMRVRKVSRLKVRI